MLSSAYESIPVSQCIPLPFPDLVPTCLFSASMSLSASELKSCASLVAQMVKNLPAMQEIQVQSVGQEDPWRREWLPTPVFLLENPEDREAWQAI